MKRALPRLVICLSLLCCLSLAGQAMGALDYPRPQTAVADYAKIIPPDYARRINLAATELLQKTGAAVVVATVPSLDGETIEQAAVHLFQKWGIGKKGEDKGLLFLIAPKERRLRIEVGYGLEGVITDATAGAIRDQALVPYLKKGQIGPAMLAGVSAAAGIIAGDAGVQLTGVPKVKVRVRSGRGFGWGGLILAVLVFFWMIRSARRRGKGGPGARGGGSGILPAMLLGSMLGSSMGGGHRGGGFDSFGGGFGGFGGGMSGGGGVSGGW